VTQPIESDFSAISERPVFSATRRPPPPPSVAAAAAPTPAAPPVPPPPVNVILIGIMIEPGKNFAVLKTPSSPTTLTVSEGDTVNGWQVGEILADRVVFRINASEQEILFPKPSIGAASSSAAGMPRFTAPRPAVTNPR
jgi:hypothetical protein